MLHIKIYLLIWALQADVIASQYCSHHYRTKLIRALWQQMQEQSTHTDLWKRTLNHQLRNLIDNETLTHTEVRQSLQLYQATCMYISKNWDETWFSYAKEKYNHSGEQYPTSNPFTDFLIDNDDDDQLDFLSNFPS